MRLGRLPHDPAAVALVPRLEEHYAVHEWSVPQVLDRSRVAYQPQLRHNDTLPDCAIAGILNLALAQEARTTGSALALADDCELGMYAQVSGCAPTLEAIAVTDGLSLVDVLRSMGRQGFDTGLLAPLTGDCGSVPLTLGALSAVTAQLGAVYLGVDLDPDYGGPAAWRSTGRGDPTLGHCLLLWDWAGLGDSDAVRLVTWGGFQQATWGWLMSHAQEAYAVLLPGLVSPAGLEGTGLDSLRAAGQEWLRGV